MNLKYMNLKLTHYIRHFQKHKYVYMGTGLLLVVLGVFFWTRRGGLREGFSTTVGEYQYLAPPPLGNTISNEVYERFFIKRRDELCKNKASCKVNLMSKDQYAKHIVQDEMEYYIEVGEWPWSAALHQSTRNAAIQAALKENKEIDEAKFKAALKKAQKQLPSRLAYEQLGGKETDATMDPKPLAYLTYMNMLPKEVTASVEAPAALNARSKMKQNYESLIDLCKRVHVDESQP